MHKSATHCKARLRRLISQRMIWGDDDAIAIQFFITGTALSDWPNDQKLGTHKVPQGYADWSANEGIQFRPSASRAQLHVNTYCAPSGSAKGLANRCKPKLLPDCHGSLPCMLCNHHHCQFFPGLSIVVMSIVISWCMLLIMVDSTHSRCMDGIPGCHSHTVSDQARFFRSKIGRVRSQLSSCVETYSRHRWKQENLNNVYFKWSKKSKVAFCVGNSPRFNFFFRAQNGTCIPIASGQSRIHDVT